MQAWNESKKFYNFQGLWHTHPEDVPTPSPTDLRDIDTVLNGITNLNDPVLYLIIGRVKTGIWIGRKNFKIKLLGYIELN
uniref:Mov34/MPN/PAD-1 family protein n=1 Tax=Acinetobacter gerneri TaxID=202952 RepID=UPI00293BEA47|nr:Mov34/MPN/PAD-1 family protein [Acinetobacter gerneri]